ncbi:MAG: hypothetical protein EHM61_11575 [Acidobacteria bacterium]|nr:MAG: hypothetical protein EHM61_11575 [Acidobacteriota bacterium]
MKRLNKKAILLFLLLGSAVSVPNTNAQRVFATVNPTTIDESLRFDTNNIALTDTTTESGSTSTPDTADLNFSPNVIFAPDSTRAFVGYPGSDTVMVFDPHTGTIERLIEVDPNPGRMTLSPNGHTIAVPCVRLTENTPRREDSGLKVGTIALIDVETLAVRRLELTNVLLSLANNIVFSADGQTALIASFGTDQLIRFDVGTAAEISPRLEFTAGHRPASISLSPDSKTAAIVLAGSANLDRSENPDAVALIDVINFQLLKKIAPPTNVDLDDDGTVEHFIHDFTALTNFAFSPDGKFGIIADCQFSNLSTAPELSADRAWIFDFEAEAFLTEPVTVGAVASVSYVTPDSRFLVMSPFDLVFVDPIEAREAIGDEKDIPTTKISPAFSNFKSGSRPLFSPDGRFLYIAAPLNDTVVRIDFETSEIRTTKVGGDVERNQVDVDDGDDDYELETVTLTSAPLDLALSPDGSVLAVVNFNANTIDLVRESWHSYVPAILFDDDRFIGLAITNASETAPEFDLTGFYSSGSELVDADSTEDVIEYVNPITVDLAPRAEMTRTLEEWVSARQPESSSEADDEETSGDSEDDSDTTPGWVDLNCPSAETRALFLTGDRDLKRLDGSVAAQTTSQRLVFPEVRVANGWNTELVLLNPNLSSTSVVVELVNDRGQIVGSFERVLAGGASSQDLVRQPDDDEDNDSYLFNESVFEKCDTGADGSEDEDEDDDEEYADGSIGCGFTSGYLIVRVKPDEQATEDESEEADDEEDEEEFVVRGGVVAFARYFDPERMEVLIGIEAPYPQLEGQASASGPAVEARQFYLPQVVSLSGNETILELVNPTTHVLNIALELRESRQTEAVSAKTISIKPAHVFRGTVSEVFGLARESLFTGWILFNSDAKGLVGSAELLIADDKAATTLPLQSLPTERLVFSHLVQAGDLSTGLSLVNIASEPARLTLALYSPEGQRVALCESIPLLPLQRFSALLKECFPAMGDQVGGHIEVRSDRPITGVEMFFKNDLELVSAVLPQ